MTQSTKSVTLTEFLLARIAEDEAEATSKPADWLYGYHDDFNQRLTMSDMGPGYVLTVGPLRVHAECEAKRRIVVAHRWDEEWENGVRFASDCEDCWQSPPCHTLRTLASVYADHPDYDEAWRP